MTSSLEWRGYQIKAGLVGGKPAAQVYLGLKRATAERFTGASVEAAIEAAQSWIDARLAASFAARRAPYVATAAEYADYFTVHPVPERVRRMLAAHVQARQLTLRQLAAAAEWDSLEVASLHYGALAHDAADWIGLQVWRRPSDDLPVFRRAFADEAGWDERGELLIEIHPEVVEGLHLSGVLSRR